MLLEQKHELEYKLNKTNELSEQQIKDLEETVDNYNHEMNLIKRNFETLTTCSISSYLKWFYFRFIEKYESQLIDLNKQMEAMESQIKSDKAFIEVNTFFFHFLILSFSNTNLFNLFPLKTQLAEREQEREEYEYKINDLKQLLTKKSTQFLDIEDSYTKKVKLFE